MTTPRPNPELPPIVCKLGDLEGVVVSARRTCAVIELVAVEGAPYCVAQEVRLTFLTGGAVQGRRVQGRVQALEDQEDRLIVEVEIDPTTGELLCSGLGYRDDYRVFPDPKNPLEVRLRPRGTEAWYRTLLKDVSASGMGVLVDAFTDRALAEHREVDIVLELPGLDSLIACVGRIRYRRLVGCGIKHGVEFAPDLTPGFASVERRVNEYVMNRQRQLLQSSRGLDVA